MDVIVASFLLILISPMMLLIAVCSMLLMGRPVLFRQARPGLSGRVFDLVKFRTMSEQRDASGELLPDAMRVTRFGTILRATSLDELPELWNVLKGDMSLVGPRPLLVEYLPYYTPEQHRRHSVRPGLTGLAQINGRNRTTWAERLGWDMFYVDNRSLTLDCWILARTILAVFKSDGGIESIAALGKFRGSSEAGKPLTDKTSFDRQP
jgi:lipopolysaccharide/colanic/teichoic acid biosynthesis glycosyltransferase